MQQTFNKLSRISIIYALCFGFLASTLTYVLTSKYTILVGNDSVHYYSMARHFILGDGLMSFDNQYKTVWAPLYPVMLGIVGIANPSELLILGAIFNLVMIFIINACVYIVVESRLGQIYALVGSSLILFGLPMIYTSVYLLSELLFALLCFIFLVSLESYTRSKSIVWLCISIFLAALTSLTRYIGVVNIGLLTLIVLWENRFSLLKIKTIGIVFITVVTSSFPLSLWMLRNYRIDGTLLGIRYDSGTGLLENISLTYETIISWFLTPVLADIQAIQILVIVGLVILMISQRANLTKIMTMKSYPLVVICSLFIVLYTAFLVMSSTSTFYDPINTRLLSPIYIPLILIMIAFVKIFGDDFIKMILVRFIPKYTIVPLSIFSVSLLLIIVTSYIVYEVGWSFSMGYTSTTWRNHETIQSMLNIINSEENIPLQIYSNEPRGVGFYLLDYELDDSIQIWAVPREIVATIERDITAEAIAWDVQTPTYLSNIHIPSYLVWFEPNPKFNFILSETISELEKNYSLRMVGNYKDGTIYYIE